VLESPSLRHVHIQALVELARRDRAGGLLIDYEELTTGTGVFSDFIDELARELHRDARTLAVATPSPCGRVSCRHPRGSFDLAALARAADQLVVMAYDYATDGTEPVAPANWFRATFRTTREIASEDLHKVVVGLPLFGRVERTLFSGDNSLLWVHVASGTVRGVPVLVSNDRYVPSALSRQALMTHPSGNSGQFHYEDHESLAARLRLVEQEGFDAVALWRIGGEDPRIWGVLRRWKSRSHAQPEP
jgi:spore germination protein YaaH